MQVSHQLSFEDIMKSYVKNFLVLFSALLIFSSIKTTLACTCSDYGVPSCKRYSDADAVFVGKIERITSAADEKDASVTSKGLNSISWDSLGLIVVHFKVEKSFKGVQSKILKALTYKGTSCDLKVKKGQRWVVFASKDEETGFLSFGSCGGNYEIENNTDEPTEIGNISKGIVKANIIGRIAEDSFADGTKDIKVNLEGDGTNFSTVTDKNGYYKFANLQPGFYKVKLFIPFSAAAFTNKNLKSLKSTPTETETVFEYEVEVQKGVCDYESIYHYKIDLKATAEIKWRFSNEEGKSIESVDVELCRVKSTEMETLKNCIDLDQKDSDGSSLFNYLREGDFVLVVSKEDFPEFDSPYPRIYFPGVRNFSEAQIINLEQKQKLQLPNFKLPPSMPTQEVKGRLFWKNGKPIAPKDLNDDGVYFAFYNFQGGESSLSMSHFISPSETTEDGLKLNNDGSFSFRAFVGMKYTVKFTAHNKKGKKLIKQSEIKVDENLKPLEIILEDN